MIVFWDQDERDLVPVFSLSNDPDIANKTDPNRQNNMISKVKWSQSNDLQQRWTFFYCVTEERGRKR